MRRQSTASPCAILLAQGGLPTSASRGCWLAERAVDTFSAAGIVLPKFAAYKAAYANTATKCAAEVEALARRYVELHPTFDSTMPWRMLLRRLGGLACGFVFWVASAAGGTRGRHGLRFRDGFECHVHFAAALLRPC